jgi:hypothetical protein
MPESVLEAAQTIGEFGISAEFFGIERGNDPSIGVSHFAQTFAAAPNAFMRCEEA